MKPVEVEILMKGNSLSHGLDDARQKSDLLTSSLRRLSQTAAGVLSVREALEFGKAMIRVRSEIEKLEISFETLLGNKGAASELMTELKTFAARTPLQLNDLAQAEQTLLAFNVPAEETVGILHAIGDISMGDSQKLQSLTLAFSQMSSTGKLMGQDLLQMINAGFNPLSVISEKTGKSIGELKEAMSDGAISADMVREAFISATSEGGKFYKMLEKQSESQAGSMSNLQGAWNDMLNDIGTKTQDTVSGSIQMLTSLVKNYEQVGRIVTGLIATYGAYKAAVMFATAAEKGWTIAELAHFRALTLAAKAQALMNATMLANPYVLAATAIVGLVAAVWALHDSTTAAEREAARLKEREDEQQEELSDLKKKIDDLLGVVEDETSAEYDRQKALEDLKELMPSVFGKYKTEKELLEDLTAARKAENEEISRRNNLLGKQNYNEDKSQLSQWQRYRELHNKSNGHADPLRGNYGGLSREEYYEMQGIWERTILPNRNKTKSEFESFDSWLNNQIKALSGTVNQEAEKERQKAATSWNSKLQTMDVKELEGDIDRNKKRLKTMDESGKDYILMDGIPIHRSELERRIKEGSSRKKTLLENGRKDFAKDAKTQLEAEQKTLRSLASLSDPEKRGKSQMTYNGKKVREMNASEYETAIKEQQKKVDAAQGKVDSFDKASNGGKKPKDTSAKEQKEEERRQRNEKDIAQSIEDLALDTEHRKNEIKEEGIAKRLSLAKDERDGEMSELDKKHAQLEEKRGGNLTAEEEQAFADARLAIEEAYSKKQQDIIKEETKSQYDALNEYLKEYGTYEQQKLAITKQYEEQINAATTAGEKASLMMRRDAELQQLGNDSLEKRMDWSGVFGELSGHTKEYLQGLRDQLQSIMKEGNLPVDQMAVVSDKIREIDGYLAQQRGIWDFIGTKAAEHNRLVQESADAQERLNAAKHDEQNATETLVGIQRQIADALGKESSSDISSSDMLNGLDMQSAEYKTLLPLITQLTVAEGKLADARKKTAKATNEAKNAEDKSKRNSSQAVADWFADAQQFITEKGIDQLPELFNSLGMEGLGEKASQGLSAFGNAAGAAADFATGNYIGAALKGISAIKDFGHVLGIGGGNEAEVAETTERLTKANELLRSRIEDLTDVIGDSAGMKALNAYDTALSAQKEINANAMEVLKAQMGYHSSHHSNNYYADDNVIAGYNDAAQKAFAAAGVTASTINGLSSIYNLTPEQLKAIKDFAPDLWKYLTEVGKYDKSEYWDAVVEQAGKTDELTEQINENLTQTSFGEMRSSFLSSLTDMSNDAKAFSESLEDMFFEAAVNSFILDDEFDAWLKDWQSRWAAANKNKDSAAQSGLIEEATDKRNELAEKRDDLAAQMGYSGHTSQSGKAGGFTAMSQDQGTKLEGLFVSGQMHWSSIDDKMDDVTERMDAAQEHLRQIAEHTGACRGSLGTIADDLKKIIRDGLKMK